MLPEGWKECTGPTSIGVASPGPTLLDRGKLTDKISNENQEKILLPEGWGDSTGGEEKLLPEGWRECPGPTPIGLASPGPTLLCEAKLANRIGNEEEENEEILPEGWKKNTGPTSIVDNNEKRGGSAPGNPMLATPKPSSNCGGEVIYIQNLSVDAEKNKIGGESAPGNPMLTPPGLEGCPAQSITI